MATGLSITVDSSAVQANLARAPRLIFTRLRTLVEGAAISVQRELRTVAPVGATGRLRNSIKYTFTLATLSAEVVPDVPYAEYVEYGTKPHWPPYGPGTPLAAWAGLKGIDPFLVARSISKKGTQAHPFVRPTYEKMKPVIQEELATGISAIVEELNHGL